jgi:hypothetical protein
MIFYNIQHFGDGQHLPSLAQLLGHEGNHLSVSLDADISTLAQVKSSFSASTQMLRSFDISNSAPLSWGGISITRNMLEQVNRALQTPDWSYFVNLSGDCLPLMSQKDIFKLLNFRWANDGKRSFCYSFTPKLAKHWFSVSGDKNPQPVNYGRALFDLEPGLARSLERGHFDPSKLIMQRIAASYTEKSKGEFLVRGLSIDELKQRLEFFAENDFRVGRQWVVLHRSHAEWLANSEDVKKLMELLKSCFISDESFFQMALFSSFHKDRHSVENRSLRLNEGGASLLSASAASAALDSGCIFGRKTPAKERAQCYALLSQRIA